MAETPGPPETPEQVVGAELVDGETLAWTGRAGRDAYTGSNPFRTLFGRIVLIGGLVALYYGYDAVSVNPRSPGLFGIMFGLIFTIFGAGLAIKPYWHWYTALHTFYGVTNRRAMIIRTKPWFAIRNFANLQIEGVAQEYNGDGTGNVIFATEPFGRVRALRAAVGFWGAEDPDGAAAALTRLKES
ncbi:MAG: hypothetical protein OXR84_01890 [Magnetovibrio sp.]|nr:hypothetical protein [Magnetovibrio sp.]